MKNPWVIIIVIAIVLFGGAMWLSNASNENNNEGVEVKEHVLGNPEAEVVLVEYSDLQCPSCAQFDPIMKDVIALYGDSLRFEYKHYPLPIHPFAINAAIAAEAAGQQDKFFEYTEVLFERQSQWANVSIPTGLFVSYAEELGLDVELFQRHMKSTILRDKVRDSLDEAREMQLTGTPTFFLNGERMQIQTYEDFVNQIAAAVDPDGATASSTDTTSAEVKFGI